MKVIECNPKQPVKPGVGGSIEKAQGLLSGFSSAASKLKAQKTFQELADRNLNHRFLLLQQAQLEGFDDLSPLILIGPAGLFVIEVSAVKGVFQAKGQSLFEMKGRSGEFVPARPNLIQQTLDATQVVKQHLESFGLSQIEVHPILIFVTPRVHLESVRPDVRIILWDGIDRFTKNLAYAKEILNPKQAEALAQLFKGEVDGEPRDLILRDIFAMQEEEKPQAPTSNLPHLPQADIIITDKVIEASDRVRFSSRQWLIIGVLIVVNILILIGVILFILGSS
jgi:hypothetical protein